LSVHPKACGRHVCFAPASRLDRRSRRRCATHGSGSEGGGSGHKRTADGVNGVGRVTQAPRAPLAAQPRGFLVADREFHAVRADLPIEIFEITI